MLDDCLADTVSGGFSCFEVVVIDDLSEFRVHEVFGALSVLVSVRLDVRLEMAVRLTCE